MSVFSQSPCLNYKGTNVLQKLTLFASASGFCLILSGLACAAGDCSISFGEKWLGHDGDIVVFGDMKIRINSVEVNQGDSGKYSATVDIDIKAADSYDRRHVVFFAPDRRTPSTMTENICGRSVRFSYWACKDEGAYCQESALVVDDVTF